MDTYIMTSDTMEAVSLVAAQRERRLSREAPGGTWSSQEAPGGTSDRLLQHVYPSKMEFVLLMLFETDYPKMLGADAALIPQQNML